MITGSTGYVVKADAPHAPERKAANPTIARSVLPIRAFPQRTAGSRYGAGQSSPLPDTNVYDPSVTIGVGVPLALLICTTLVVCGVTPLSASAREHRSALVKTRVPTDAPMSGDRAHKRRMPQLREGPRPAARLWRPRRGLEHAVANDPRGESKG